MKIPAKVMKFRSELASDIDKVFEWLKDADITIIGDVSSIISALKSSNAKTIPNESTKESYWGYELDNFVLKLTNRPRNTLPKKAKALEIIFDNHIVSDHEDLDSIKDPFKYLIFNMVILGRDKNKKQYINSWHLDRHLGGETKEAHAIYHMHYGGAKLNGRSLGDSLLLDAPRLVHYPMDFILGIDFILSNFFPSEWDYLLNKTEYPMVIQKYQKYFLKPYSFALASHWNKNFGMPVEWASNDVCPTLI